MRLVLIKLDTVALNIGDVMTELLVRRPQFRLLLSNGFEVGRAIGITRPDAHASHAIDNGAPITLVSQTLGHADLKTTSVYAHARPNESSSRYLKPR
jgi:integrase